MKLDEAAASRARAAWEMRQSGLSYRQIAENLGVCTARARQIVAVADGRMARASQVYDAPVTTPVVYGVWHTFTHSGRVTKY